MKVRDVMTKEVTTVSPDMSLKDVASILIDKGISGLPVVDADGTLLGVVSEADILAKERDPAGVNAGWLGWLLDPQGPAAQLKLEARTAREAMTSPATTITPERPVYVAATEMIEQGFNRLPVVDDGKLVGIVTRADLVRAFVRSDAEIEREIREDVVLRTLWIAPESLSIFVRNGEVTLKGQVESEDDADLAAAFAGRVPGVVSVDSKLSWLPENGKGR